MASEMSSFYCSSCDCATRDEWQKGLERDGDTVLDGMESRGRMNDAPSSDWFDEFFLKPFFLIPPTQNTQKTPIVICEFLLANGIYVLSIFYEMLGKNFSWLCLELRFVRCWIFLYQHFSSFNIKSCLKTLNKLFLPSRFFFQIFHFAVFTIFSLPPSHRFASAPFFHP